MAMATSSNSGVFELSKDEFGSNEEIAQESPEDAKFDAIVGELENLLLDEEFLKMQEKYLKSHSHQFDEDEENKLVYMDIFRQWTQHIEAFFEKRLKRNLPWFSMREFTELLRTRATSETEGDVFDVLATLGDFAAFKDLMLGFKHEQEGTGIDLSGLLIQTSTSKAK